MKQHLTKVLRFAAGLAGAVSLMNPPASVPGGNTLAKITNREDGRGGDASIDLVSMTAGAHHSHGNIIV